MQHVPNETHMSCVSECVVCGHFAPFSPSRVVERNGYLESGTRETDFRLAIKDPVAPPYIDAKDEIASNAPVTFAHRPRVVIVEDEVIIAMELEMLLEDLKTDVVGIAASAAQACALVNIQRPDFVTMDINLKGDRDGISAAIEIFETLGVRSIFITSHSNSDMQKKAEQCNPIAWIRKPINAADLADAIKLV